MNDYFGFPHTPHLAWLGAGSPRHDKVLSPADAEKLLSGEVLVEEKLDGANLGFSLSRDGSIRVQNRGQYLQAPYRGQFSRLGSWIAIHRNSLEVALRSELILFGEWCAARHSIGYSALPDWFLGFDVYDRAAASFWSTQRRNHLLSTIGIQTVPAKFRGRTSLDALTRLLSSERSSFQNGPMEGVIVRNEGSEWLAARAKLVRADFAQGITEHWSGRTIEWNQVAPQTVQ